MRERVRLVARAEGRWHVEPIRSSPCQSRVPWWRHMDRTRHEYIRSSTKGLAYARYVCRVSVTVRCVRSVITDMHVHIPFRFFLYVYVGCSTVCTTNVPTPDSQSSTVPSHVEQL